MLKTIKKKDALCMYIEESKPDKLYLKVIPKENNRITVSCLHIQTIQNIPIPTGYENPVIIPSNEYQRTLKDMGNISDTLNIRMRQYSMQLLCNVDNIFSREVFFGEMDDDTDYRYMEEFNMEQLSRIIKIAGLSKTLQVYGKPNLPLLIQSEIGSIGTIKIFIKSKKQLKQDTTILH